jgi:hypothetical protein
LQFNFLITDRNPEFIERGDRIRRHGD